MIPFEVTSDREENLWLDNDLHDRDQIDLTVMYLKPRLHEPWVQSEPTEDVRHSSQ